MQHELIFSVYKLKALSQTKLFSQKISALLNRYSKFFKKYNENNIYLFHFSVVSDFGSTVYSQTQSVKSESLTVDGKIDI